jgi:hypothetical protein
LSNYFVVVQEGKSNQFVDGRQPVVGDALNVECAEGRLGKIVAVADSKQDPRVHHLVAKFE